METEKIEKKKNELLGRLEITSILNYSGATPRREEIKKTLCSKLAANPELAVLVKTETSYGKQVLKTLLHVYESAEQMKKIEPNYLLVREKLVAKQEKKKKEKKPTEKKE